MTVLTLPAPTTAPVPAMPAAPARPACPAPRRGDLIGDLGDDARAALDRDGYVVLPDLGDPAWLEQARARYEHLVRLEAADAVSVSRYANEFHREVGARRLPDLVNKGALFDHVWTHPLVLAVAAHVIARPFKLSALSGRDALRGHGHQALHADWGPRAAGEPFHVVNCIWALDGFSPANGGPRLVPGSHRFPHAPVDAMPDAAADHPDQIVPVVPPGAVLAMNAHTWHGGTANRDGTPRRAYHAYFCAREHTQQLDQREYLRVRTAERLGPAARYLLDA
jgi:ectoine hydroxylase-related dioxygenase (phytanoyl-CoA dioxygenase family)